MKHQGSIRESNEKKVLPQDFWNDITKSGLYENSISSGETHGIVYLAAAVEGLCYGYDNDFLDIANASSSSVSVRNPILCSSSNSGLSYRAAYSASDNISMLLFIGFISSRNTC